jgi:hypothetical protein
MKTSELTGAALDWAVAKCEGHGMEYFQVVDAYTPSTDWAQGGPIIEREEIALEPMTHDEHGDGWLATRVEGPAVCMEFGPTMLIAAMRCYVASHLGDEVDVPEELK